MTQSNVLLVEDDDDLRPAINEGLEIEGFTPFSLKDGNDALSRLSPDFDGVVVSDIKMPRIDGLTLMSRVLEIDAAIPVILITGHADVPLAVEAMRGGAYDFLEKPFAVSNLANIVRRALEKRRLVLENRALRNSLPSSETLADMLVGDSGCMQRLRADVQAISQTDADVLILGETGAGKEVVSRAIHQASERRQHPFVAINCGALPSDLIESELFGHEKGAFTGAQEARIGKIEHADKGTILLDEIESMPMDLQVKLLRVLEERAIERLGSNKAIPVDVRFIAATKENLEKAGREKRFRPDLFYRLNVVSLNIPPLRERKEDIPDLFFHLCRLARARYRREIPEISAALLEELTERDWPGNVRELRNVADRFVLGLAGAGGVSGGPDEANQDLGEAVARFEASFIRKRLEKNDGKLKPTYEGLGISRKTLYDKMKRYGIEVDPE